MGQRFFHGGKGGLVKGNMILPPSITGVPSCARYGAAGLCRTDRVYVTTDERAALMFAALHYSGKGATYEVEPIGELIADPDCDKPYLSFECERARILVAHRIPDKLRNEIIKQFLKAPMPEKP